MPPEHATAEPRANLFAFAIAHDLRQPLLASLLTVEGLLTRASDSTTRSGLELVRDGLRDGLTRVESLLALARLTQLEPVLEPMNLSQHVASVVGQLSAAHPNIEVELDQSGVTQLHCDARFLAIVLDNLLSNALKHGRSPDGTCRVHVAAQATGTQATITIRDRGRGFSSGPVIDDFASSSSGLGLAIATAAVEHIGGRLWHEPADPGTIAYVCIPTHS